MIHLSFVLLSLAQLTQSIATNATNSDSCPLHDGTTRSIWSILGSCVLTLLICVWHTLHFPVTEEGGVRSLLFKTMCGIGSFFAPEALITFAGAEWMKARRDVNRFRERGYEWSMTHSFFAMMDGFIYLDEEGRLDKIDSLKFLDLCEANKIANPIITVKQIKALSKSDGLGNAILAIQLLWFMLQVVVRGSQGLAVTLVELDTVSMAVLSLLVIFLWWDKPLSPESSYTFYYSPPGVVSCPRTRLLDAWKPEPGLLDRLKVCFTCSRKKQLTTDEEEVALVGKDGKPASSKSRKLLRELDRNTFVPFVLCGTWMILGALHLIAWDFEFLTEVERTMWRVSSLVLAGAPLVFLGAFAFSTRCNDWIPTWVDKGTSAVGILTTVLGVASRAVLVGLMLASLRALPPSAHQVVSWTMYIPHL